MLSIGRDNSLNYVQRDKFIRNDFCLSAFKNFFHALSFGIKLQAANELPTPHDRFEFCKQNLLPSYFLFISKSINHDVAIKALTVDEGSGQYQVSSKSS